MRLALAFARIVRQKAVKAMPKLAKVTVKLPWVEGEWVADEDQQRAAWEMYVELVTRVSVQPLRADEGLLREALSSLYALFAETRRVLKQYGPGLATPARAGSLSFGQIAVDVLNQSLRPLLAKWHPLLQAHEAVRPPGMAPSDHERAWPQAAELRGAIEAKRAELGAYADLLAGVCGIAPLHQA
jgi:hypothetical protein